MHRINYPMAMYCPRCGQERISEDTSFCSRCGYLLTGTAELLQTGGMLQAAVPEGPSERRVGVRQGISMIMAMFVLAPVVGLITLGIFGDRPWPVGIVVAVLGLGGIFRIIHALLFGSKHPRPLPAAAPSRHAENSAPGNLNDQSPAATLTSGTPNDYVSPDTTRWPRAADKIPLSVTDSTTRHLNKDAIDREHN